MGYRGELYTAESWTGRGRTWPKLVVVRANLVQVLPRQRFLLLDGELVSPERLSSPLYFLRRQTGRDIGAQPAHYVSRGRYGRLRGSHGARQYSVERDRTTHGLVWACSAVVYS